MTTATKNMTSLIVLALFGLAFVSDASLASGRGWQAADDDIEVCVVEINRNADYTNASRVVHRVVGLEQVNIAELKVRIETSVYRGSDADAVKQYEASCITGALNRLVRFRMKGVELPET